MSKTIGPIGPAGGNTCCICCHECCGFQTLPHGCGVENCCPCPTENYDGFDVRIMIQKAAGGTDTMMIPLKSYWGYTCDDDVMGCYDGTPDISKTVEKWGSEPGKRYCTGGSDCEGQYIQVSLCCCPGAPNGPDYDCSPQACGDCNTCNFNLFMSFLPGSGPDYSDKLPAWECSCPDDYDEIQMVPGDTPITQGPKQICFDFKGASACGNPGNPWMIRVFKI